MPKTDQKQATPVRESDELERDTHVLATSFKLAEKPCFFETLHACMDRGYNRFMHAGSKQRTLFGSFCLHGFDKAKVRACIVVIKHRACVGVQSGKRYRKF